MDTRGDRNVALDQTPSTVPSTWEPHREMRWSWSDLGPTEPKADHHLIPSEVDIKGVASDQTWSESRHGVVEQGLLSRTAEAHKFGGGYQNAEELGVLGNCRFDATGRLRNPTDTAGLRGGFEPIGE